MKKNSIITPNITHKNLTTGKIHKGEGIKCKICFKRRFGDGRGFAAIGTNLPKLKYQK